MSATRPDPEGLAEPLIRWYALCGRSLPWRDCGDAYRIWVSEIMLQQTRVETVRPYFAAFLERFPTVEALAAAEDEAVRSVWSGLGFYRRVRNLHAAAKIVVEEYGGCLPRDPAELRSLPGIGRYTAGAILSAAYNQKLPILDGNVIRVLSRVFRVEGSAHRASTQRVLWGLAEAILPDDRPGDFNQALMDLGATVCTPSGPKCGVCPFTDLCAAKAAGVEEELPTPGPRAKLKAVSRVALCLERVDGTILLQQRPSEGLLASLWELPATSISPGSPPIDAARELAEGLAAAGTLLHCGRYEHRFSHRHWTVEVFRAQAPLPADWQLPPGGSEAPARVWFHPDAFSELGLPTASLKGIDLGQSAAGGR